MRIKPASPFPWRSTELDFKLALHPHSRFTPLIECCVPPFGREGHSYSGSYFGLGIWHDRCGYLSTLGYRHSFRECEFPLKDFDALRKRLKAISIPLDGGALAFDGPQGLIRVYDSDAYLDFFYRSAEASMGPAPQVHQPNLRSLPACQHGCRALKAFC